MKEILKELCLLDSVPGYEQEVRTAIERMAKPYADEIIVDCIGNLLVFKKGHARRVRPLVVAAHMDEPGFLVSGYTDDGCLKLIAAGSLDIHGLAGYRVRVGADRHSGILARKSINLVKAEARKESPALTDLYVDIGCSSRADAQAIAAIGDPVSLDCPFVEYGDQCIKAKALSSRTGCAVALKMLQDTLPYDTWFAFTVGTEISETGAHGSIVVGNRLQPGGALILESCAANDLPGIPAHKQCSMLRHGPVISLIDIETVYHRGLRKKVLAAADQAGVRWQYRRDDVDTNDASALHVSGAGALAFGLAVPTRYLHGPANVLCLSDLDEMYRLAVIFNEEAGELDV